MVPAPQRLHWGVTSRLSAELFVPSKHSVIDASANQDSDHTPTLLQLTSAKGRFKPDPDGRITLHTVSLMSHHESSTSIVRAAVCRSLHPLSVVRFMKTRHHEHTVYITSQQPICAPRRAIITAATTGSKR